MTDQSPKILSGYGSLYLDRGERMPKVSDQLNALRARLSSDPGLIMPAFGFDVLYGTGQKALATRLAAQIETAIQDTFRDCTPDDFKVMVAAEQVKSTGAEGTRPAREWLMRLLEGNADKYVAELREHTPAGAFIEGEITPGYRALVERELPNFTKALAECRAGKAPRIIMTISAFGPTRDAALLHAALHVASEDGVEVVFAPEGAVVSAPSDAAISFARDARR